METDMKKIMIITSCFIAIFSGAVAQAGLFEESEQKQIDALPADYQELGRGCLEQVSFNCCMGSVKNMAAGGYHQPQADLPGDDILTRAQFERAGFDWEEFSALLIQQGVAELSGDAALRMKTVMAADKASSQLFRILGSEKYYKFFDLWKQVGDGCGSGFQKEMVRCMGAYSWCEPIKE
jgi:hypothetical protein